jgi:hypothetical protein
MHPNELTSQVGRHYLEAWRKIVPTFLGWSDEKVLSWAEKWKDDMNDPGAGFYNRTPIEYVVPLFIPETLKARLSISEAYNLRHRIQGAVDSGDSFIARKPNFDCEAARERVEAILREYGATLPCL